MRIIRNNFSLQMIANKGLVWTVFLRLRRQILRESSLVNHRFTKVLSEPFKFLTLGKRLVAQSSF